MSETDIDAPDAAPRLTAGQKRLGQALLRCWLAGAVVYVIAAGAWSADPIRQALAEAPGLTGAAVKVILRQAGIAFAPPLLVLWFGWDVWFAVIGFLGPRRRTQSEPPSAPTR